MSRAVRPGVCGEAPDPGNEPGDGWLVRGDDQGSDGLNPARGVGDADPSGGSSSGWRHQVAKNAAADLSAGPHPHHHPARSQSAFSPPPVGCPMPRFVIPRAVEGHPVRHRPGVWYFHCATWS